MRIVIIIALCLHLIAPLAVWAQAAAKGPLDYSLKQYGLILGVATLGGLVSWYGKVSRGVLPPWSIHHLVGELVTSSLAGLLCFWLCEWAGLAPLLTAALVGLSGHAGVKGIQLLENWAAKRFQERAGGAS